MAARAVPARTETANERWKSRWEQWLWSSMSAAVVLHFAVFALWPEMTAADVSTDSNELEAIPLAEKVELPPPPAEIPRPATPIVGDTNIDEDITMISTDFDDHPPETFLRPPAASSAADSAGGPDYVPWDVPPTILNLREVQEALQREYPSVLRDAGIEGVVRVWFRVDETGRVVERRIEESSGHPQFDEAALAVADLMEFSPAQNRDRRVAVGVVFPIRFRVH